MSARPGNLKTEQLDMESLFDFTQSTTQPSPAPGSSSKVDVTPKTANQDWSAISPYDQPEHRQFSGPSHDYNQYKQQVGLPSGSMANMPPQSMYDGYSSGIGDMGFDGGFGGWNSGIDLDADMNVDFNNPSSAMPAMFFPSPANNNNADNFVDPSSIGGEEPTSHVGRLWPGMHSQQAQQAAMQKAAQVHAVQQRQMKMQAQQAQYRQAVQPTSNGHAKRPSNVTEPHVEESISRLLNQMRQNSNAGDMDEDDSSSNSLLPQLARLKKDEEEMDEDERLLASDEGKKLSSKERRQLRNKVSARAFRSRRKEYIGQLEGEVAMKAQEANNLRTQNAALMHENDNYRALIETLLRHPSFSTVLQDFSQDPSALLPPRQQQAPQQPRPSATPSQQPSQPQQQPQQQQPQQEPDAKPDFLNFDASQIQMPGQQQTEHIGLATVPENDFSKLNINGFNAMNFNGFQRVNAFAVTDLPRGPDPAEILADLPASCSTATAFDSNLDVLLAKLDGAARNLEYPGGWA